MSQKEEDKLKITPSMPELKFARLFLIKEAQKQHFSEEYEALKNDEKISENSILKKLNPKMKNGVIIMVSRLNNLQQMPEQIKNPIILPKDAKITTLIILEHHKMAAHLGPEATLRQVRLKYWVLGGRREIRKAINSCESNLCKQHTTTTTLIDRSRNHGLYKTTPNIPVPHSCPQVLGAEACVPRDDIRE